MSSLAETEEFPPVTQLETSDLVKGGVGGKSNMQPGELTKRTAFLKARTDLRADLAYLKAIASADRFDTQIRLVKGYGLYYFDAASAAAESLPFIVAPNAGTGRWFHASQGIAGAALGFATLAANGKLVQPVPNRIVAMYSDAQTGDTTTAVNVYGDSGLTVTVLNAAVGDVLLVDLAAIMSNVGGTGSARLVAVDGGVTKDVGQNWIVSGVGQRVTAGILYTVVTAGSVVVRLETKASSGTTYLLGDPSAANHQSALRVVHVRP